MRINYRTALTGLKVGNTPVYRFCVDHNGTVGEDAFFENASRICGLQPIVLKSNFDICISQMVEELRHGYRVELPKLSAFLTMPGGFAGTSAEARAAADAKLSVRLAAKGDFKTCCQGGGFTLENVTQGATVVIRGVNDMVLKQDNVISCGTDVEVHIVGTGLYLGDGSDPDTGVWLANADGEMLASARIVESTATTLVCTFAQVGLEPGAYKLCVASRNGMDPERYGVTIARRNVTVADPQAEEEGV